MTLLGEVRRLPAASNALDAFLMQEEFGAPASDDW